MGKRTRMLDEPTTGEESQTEQPHGETPITDESPLVVLARAAFPGAGSYVVVAESETQFVVEVDGAPRKLSKGV